MVLARLAVMSLTAAFLYGCGPAWSSQFREGTKLYEKNNHRYFGKVVAYEDKHDFHNGTSAQAAILIEPAEGGEAARVWGACGTCATTFTVEAP